ncbi:MAG: DNA-deoxyinosine glycosylase [Pseudomonadota bacterium]
MTDATDAGQALAGFAPLAGPGATVLILGSMPGSQSLAAQAYYAHPRNAFWQIAETLFDVPKQLDYAARCAALVATGVAVWDVLRGCRRRGSLDAAIESESAEINDFESFLLEYTDISKILCNGGYAATTYRRRVLPILQEPLARIPMLQVPSTSPAHASMSVAEKTAAWRAALQA